MLTPTRYLWLYPTQYLGVFLVSISAKIIDFFKKWDKIASRRPDNTIAISHEVSKRCLKYYGFCPPVIYPPFDLQYWVKVKKSILDSNYSQNTNVTHLKQFYLVVARLEPYKKVDVVIRAFKGRKDHLVVVGKGSLLQKMKRRAGKNVLFMEDLSDEEMEKFHSQFQKLREKSELMRKKKEGKTVIDKHGHPEIDHDLFDIAEEFKKFAKKERLNFW